MKINLNLAIYIYFFSSWKTVFDHFAKDVNVICNLIGRIKRKVTSVDSV